MPLRDTANGRQSKPSSRRRWANSPGGLSNTSSCPAARKARASERLKLKRNQSVLAKRRMRIRENGSGRTDREAWRVPTPCQQGPGCYREMGGSPPQCRHGGTKSSPCLTHAAILPRHAKRGFRPFLEPALTARLSYRARTRSACCPPRSYRPLSCRWPRPQERPPA